MKVCQISCRMNVDDTRQSRVREAILASGVQVISIMTLPRCRSTQGEGARSSDILLPRPPGIFSRLTVWAVVRALWFRFRNLRKALVAVLRIRPDVIHCIEPDSWLIGVLMKRFCGAAYVVDFEEMYSTRGTPLPRFLHVPLQHLLENWERVVLRYADAVIHVSENRKAAYAAIPAKRTLVVSHYANLKDFEIQSYSRPPQLQGKFTVLHAGALRVQYAGREMLLAIQQASRRVPGLVCLVLGGIDQFDLAYLDLVKEMIRLGTLVLKPHVPFSEVVQHMKMADVGLSLVLPTDRNLQLAFPRKLFEYLAAGLPVVASDVPDIRDTLSRYHCGLLVDARKPLEIAEGIVALADDCVLRKGMADNAANAARAALNWQAQADKLTAFYRELALATDARSDERTRREPGGC